VNKLIMIAMLLVTVTVLVVPALAADAERAPGGTPAAGAPAAAPDSSWKLLGASFGAGLIILGAGFGIGWIGSTAVGSMARQPEVAGNINTAMIIAAALIEGVTFFALIVCLLTMFF